MNGQLKRRNINNKRINHHHRLIVRKPYQKGKVSIGTREREIKERTRNEKKSEEDTRNEYERKLLLISCKVI